MDEYCYITQNTLKMNDDWGTMENFQSLPGATTEIWAGKLKTWLLYKATLRLLLLDTSEILGHF